MTFPATLFAGHRYAVVGLGRNGLPAAQALAAMGADVRVWDDGEAARTAAPLPLHDPALGYAGFDALVLSPGIPHTHPRAHPAALAAHAAGIPILSDAELLFQAVRRAGSKAGFAGITGTNGKSTTTALLHHILLNAGVESAAGGNLGTAALALPLLGDAGVYVLEMSSYMLERLTTLRFDVAALLNLSPDHLDRHGGMDGYIAAKAPHLRPPDRGRRRRPWHGRPAYGRHRRCHAVHPHLRPHGAAARPGARPARRAQRPECRRRRRHGPRARRVRHRHHRRRKELPRPAASPAADPGCRWHRLGQ